MLPDVVALRQTYERLSDEKLLRLATERAATLRPEARELLLQIVAERGLTATVANAVAVQVKHLDEATLLSYCTLLQQLPCPVCQTQQVPLNATITSEVASFIMLTMVKKKLRIACPACLDKLHSDALTASVLLGWWALPWGIIRTIQALNSNSKMKRGYACPEPNDLLRSFVHERVGRIERHKNDPAELQLLVAHP